MTPFSKKRQQGVGGGRILRIFYIYYLSKMFHQREHLNLEAGKISKIIHFLHNEIAMEDYF